MKIILLILAGFICWLAAIGAVDSSEYDFSQVNPILLFLVGFILGAVVGK